MNDLGRQFWLLNQLGQAEEARTMCEEALADVAEHYRDDELTQAAFLGNFGATLTDLGAAAIGIGYLKEAVAIAREHHGEAGFRLPTYLESLANSLLNVGKIPEAVAAQEEAVSLFRKIDNNPRGIVAQAKVGSIYMRSGSFAAAAEGYKEAIRLSKLAKRSELAEIPLRIKLAIALQNQRLYDDAIEHLQFVFDRTSPEDKMEDLRRSHAEAAGGLAFCHLAAKRYAQAEGLFSTALEYFDEHDPDSIETFKLRSNYGTALRNLDKVAEAVKLFSALLENPLVSSDLMRSSLTHRELCELLREDDLAASIAHGKTSFRLAVEYKRQTGAEMPNISAVAKSWQKSMQKQGLDLEAIRKEAEKIMHPAKEKIETRD